MGAAMLRRLSMPCVVLVFLAMASGGKAGTLNLDVRSIAFESVDNDKAQVVLELIAVRKEAAQGPGLPVENPVFDVMVEDQVTGTDKRLPVVDWRFGSLKKSSMSILFLVDTSRSMAGVPFQGAKSGMWNAISSLRPDDRFGVVTFGDGIREVQPMTRDRLKAQRVIEGLAATGTQTLLYDALEHAVRVLSDEARPGSRAIVVLSDGQDAGSRNRALDGILSNAVRNGIRVYSLGFFSQAGSGNRSVMSQIANRTGGWFASALSAADIPGQYRLFESRLHPEDVVVRAEIPEELRDGEPQQVKIRMTAEHLATKYVNAPKSVVFAKSAKRLADEEEALRLEQEEARLAALKKNLMIFGIPGAVLLLAVLILGIVRSSRKRALRRRTCAQCGVVRPLAEEPCPECARRDQERAEEEQRRLEQVKQEAIEEAGRQALANKVVLCRLVGQSGAVQGRQFEIRDPVVVAGRGDACSLLLPEEEQSISRQQAQLYYASGEWRIRNLSSKQSTFVNGRQVDDYPLRHGDTIRLGHADFQFLAN